MAKVTQIFYPFGLSDILMTFSRKEINNRYRNDTNIIYVKYLLNKFIIKTYGTCVSKKLEDVPIPMPKNLAVNIAPENVFELKNI